jgi:hypothetical protein
MNAKSNSTKATGRSVTIAITDPKDVATIESLAEEGFRSFQQEVRRIFTLALRREVQYRASEEPSETASKP